MIGRDDQFDAMWDARPDEVGAGGGNPPREPGLPDLTNMLRGDVTPDLTESIMGRLGYRRIDSAQRRRLLRRRWLTRGAAALSALAVVLIGFQVHQMSDNVRSARGVTIDAAISRDLGSPIEAVGGVTRSMRRMFTPAGWSSGSKSSPPAVEDESSVEADDEAGYRSRVPWSGLL